MANILRIFIISSLTPAIFFINGCLMMGHTISYEATPVNLPDVKPISQDVLDIQPFGNKRRLNSKNYPQFSPVAQAREFGFCSNFDSQYNPDIELQIGKVIAQHFQSKGLFKEVTFNNKEKADYYLTGDVNRYFSQVFLEPPQSRGNTSSVARSVGMQHGALGALIGSILAEAIDSVEKGEPPYTTEAAIVLSNLQLHDKSGKTVKWLNDLKFEFYGDVAIKRPCSTIFYILDDQLSILVEKISTEVESTMK